MSTCNFDGTLCATPKDSGIQYSYPNRPIEQPLPQTLEQLNRLLNAQVYPYWNAPNESTIMSNIVCNGCATEHRGVYPSDYIKHASRCCNAKPPRQLDPSNLANLFVDMPPNPK